MERIDSTASLYTRITRPGFDLLPCPAPPGGIAFVVGAAAPAGGVGAAPAPAPPAAPPVAAGSGV